MRKRWLDPVSQIQQRHRSGLVHVEESQVVGRKVVPRYGWKPRDWEVRSVR